MSHKRGFRHHAQPLAELIGTAIRRRPRAKAALVTALLAGALAAPGAAAEQRFADPFAYCAAVGTIDAPDARYAGPIMPDALARGLKAALGLPDGAPLQPLREHSIWRCMAGKVYACTFGANLPCEQKADASRSPTSAMTVFCRDEPDADVIPMVVTGRATVYAWRCAQGAPAIERQITRPDGSGYLANIWYEIARPENQSNSRWGGRGADPDFFRSSGKSCFIPDD
jgi:hypothetical protein